jgi:uncharacterized NAD-dependent epimerase/dehydratase family protein
MKGNGKYPALVYCQGALNTPNGKTAHGLIRFTHRYTVTGVIDSGYANRDAGEVIDGRMNQIPVFGTLGEALRNSKQKPTHFVIGLAPDGGRLSPDAWEDVREAIKCGLNVHAGLHDFLSDDRELAGLARDRGVELRDIRKPPDRKYLHFFSGKIEEVKALKIAVLGTDSAVGKRTTAWRLVQTLTEMDYRAEMVGTGQTAWLQGAKYSIVLDSLVNDFISGELEHAVWQAWEEVRPAVIVIEGQGSLLNPAYPGGFEILAATRPDIVVLQHAPMRTDYDGFPGYPIHPLPKQIAAVEMISDKHVVAITLNHEGMTPEEVSQYAGFAERTLGIPAFDVLLDGAHGLAEKVITYISAS